MNNNIFMFYYSHLVFPKILSYL